MFGFLHLSDKWRNFRIWLNRRSGRCFHSINPCLNILQLKELKGLENVKACKELNDEKFLQRRQLIVPNLFPQCVTYSPSLLNTIKEVGKC